MSEVVAIDLGGTAIKAGRFNREGRELATLSRPTPQPATPEAVLDTLVGLVERLDPDSEVQAIGAGIPGLVDTQGRLVYGTVNLHNWRNVPLAEQLEKATGRRAILGNDANLAGLGEVWLGGASRYSEVIFITLGTGVGGALIRGGQLHTGARGLAGELGHIAFERDGLLCPCGNRGCIEQYISAPAIARRFGSEAGDLGNRAAQGDPEALAAWRTIGRDLGASLVGLLNLLDPEAVVIGGGVSASCPFMLPEAMAEIRRRTLLPRPGFELLQAKLGNDAGRIGAARLAFTAGAL